MAATFPGGVKVFTTKAAGNQIASAHINDLQDEVVAVETELRKTSGSVVSHGSLAGLSNNDHPQYRLGSTIKYTSLGSLADNTATSITPTNNQGVLFFRTIGGDSWAIVMYDAVSGTAYALSMAAAANTNVTTGALTGTTGVDGKFTVSAHTDGKIYFENRRGSTLYPGYVAI